MNETSLCIYFEDIIYDRKTCEAAMARKILKVYLGLHHTHDAVQSVIF